MLNNGPKNTEDCKVTHLSHKRITDKNVFSLEVTVYNWWV